jgi:hypothetical protein
MDLLAILNTDVETLKARGENTALAQLQSILLPGLLLTRHVFEGLRRPLLCDGSRDGDQKKLIYSRKPAIDIVVEGSVSSGLRMVQRRPPDCRVFSAIVSPNDRHRDEFPAVDGWLDHWSWVEEDFGLPEAPQNWIDRYDRKAFTIADTERANDNNYGHGICLKRSS